MEPTEEEFQAALKVVTAYLTNLDIRVSKIYKTPIKDWVLYHRSKGVKSLIHTRLFEALLAYAKHEPEEYIEGLNIKRVRNVGEKCVALFNELMKEHYGKCEQI